MPTMAMIPMAPYSTQPSVAAVGAFVRNTSANTHTEIQATPNPAKSLLFVRCCMVCHRSGSIRT
jgi:hypothetical protein